jgi:hypothetical protein
MKKIKYCIFVISLIATAGITYAIFTLKNIPESFDWEEEDFDS